MRRFLSLSLILFLTLGFAVNDAAARGFGRARFGGGHYGKGGISSLFSKKTTQGVKSRAVPNRTGGFLRGMLIGGLLSALFLGHGMAGAIFSWILVLGLIFFILNMVRNKKTDHRYTRQG
ncbi:hypothetical protein [Legionella spiritensis]|uniref:Transmembrane protein n=1 Tax=Legionella spiritensis TaxID=452 RepID=A0A0W0Z8Q1_LEGSP|nr:hypothetical protein [Legionella spiritensis]KTD65488.1 transmembrane protein [Legionella spiritensis]SNV35889.1 transmembrane protein [Legionella spiritensis]